MPEYAPQDEELKPLISIGPFKGLNTWHSPWHMDADMMTDMSNLVLDETLGGIATVKGRGNITTGLTDALGMDVFYRRSGNPYLIVVADGVWKLVDYIAGGANVNFTLPASSWDASAQTYFVLAGTSTDWILLLAANGISTPLKVLDDFNPLAPVATKAGLDTPTSAPSAAAGAAGNLNGTYRWRVTFESTSHESSQGTIGDPLTVTNQQVALTAIPTSSDPTVTQRNVWRIGGSVPEWRLVGTIADNVTTTATDNVSDLDLGRLLDFDRDPPPSALTVLVYHKQRVFGFIEDKLRWSNYDEPEGWDPTNELPVGRGDSIITLGTTGSVLLVFKRGQTWGLFGETLADFVSVKMYDVGCTGPRAVCSAPGEVYWLAEDGIRRSDGKKIDFIGLPFYVNIREMSAVSKQLCVMGYGMGKVFVGFPGEAVPFSIVLDLKTNQWEKFSWPPTHIVPLFASISGDLGYFAFTEYTSTPTFAIRKWPNSIYGDLGSTLSWYFERKQLDSGVGKAIKVYRELEIDAPAQPGISVTVLVECEDDTLKNATATLDLTEGPVRWGLPSNIRGNYIRVKVSGSHDRKVEIHGLKIWGWVERPYSRDM